MAQFQDELREEIKLVIGRDFHKVGSRCLFHRLCNNVQTSLENVVRSAVKSIEFLKNQ